MAVIIGFGTNVIGTDFSGVCAISANWGYNPNSQKLYCLGEWTPRFNIEKPTETLSITIYGDDGSGPVYDTNPSNDCVNANGLNAGVDPAFCGVGVVGVGPGDFLVTGYSYNKSDAQLPGQETWNMTRWVSGPGITAPTYVLRMSAEGETTDEDKTGVDLIGTLVEGRSGSISAASIGQAFVKQYGTVQQVGGSSSVSGDIENGSATINYAQLWV